METLDDQLRRVLTTQVEGVDPHLSGPDLRVLAASRRSRSGRIYGQLAAAAAVLVIAVLPFVLRHQSPTLTRPAGPATVSTTPSPESATPGPPSLSPRPPAPRPTTTTDVAGETVPPRSTATPATDVSSPDTPLPPPTRKTGTTSSTPTS